MNGEADEIAKRFSDICRLSVPEYEVLQKGGEEYLAIVVGGENNIYTRALSQIQEELPPDSKFSGRVFLKRRRPRTWLASHECQILQGLLAESLTIGRESLDSEFHAKTTPFLAGEERRIGNDANHVIYGRRGAGKSTLLLHACLNARREQMPFAWVAMQNYQRREDFQVIPQVLHEILDELCRAEPAAAAEFEKLKQLVVELEAKGPGLTYQDVNVILPVLKRKLMPFVRKHGRLYLFLDDIHLLHPGLQPCLLSALYSFARGNKIYIKVTAIENLTRLFDPDTRLGLQTPGDAQVIRLDYNLVTPEVAHKHIVSILNAYVQYVGIPSISRLSGKAAMQRLTWVCAGVPRDALYIFNNALTKAISSTRTSVCVTDINMAAAESMFEKERHVSDDVQEESGKIQAVIDDIKAFCLKEAKSNAFLVHMRLNDSRYKLIQRIGDLRFIHVLHPGITPEKAGEKYQVFLLDYAFYTGFRKAPSVKEVVREPRTPMVKQLRKLPRYDYASRLPDVEGVSPA